MGNRIKLFALVGAVVLLVTGLSLAACTPSTPSSSGSSDANTPAKPAVTVPTPNENGVVTAAQWKDIYPDIYNSFSMNSQNTTRVSYLEQDPYLVTLYDGTGFAKDYGSAIGHPFTLEDVAKTARPHKLANCLTCKSPELTAIVNAEGVGVYSTEFDVIYARLTEAVSCYSCHANEPDGKLVVTSQYLIDSLGSDAGSVPDADKVCGQCHNEYYFDSETKAVKLPWKGISAMTPDAILEYYNSVNFVDFTNSISGAEMIKVQHPEFETVLGAGNKMTAMGGFTCANCHMGTTSGGSGESFASHNLTSPLANQQLIDSSCKTCHTDLAKEVAEIQATTTARETAIGLKLADLTTRIGAAAADGSKSDEEIADLRLQLRNAQFYWDFCYVENAEGAHNSALATSLLDKAESLVDGALAKF